MSAGLRATRIFRRAYSTPSLPETAKRGSLPIQVALRRSQTGVENVDQDRARYDLLVARGKFAAAGRSAPTYEDWLERTTRRRRRVRGTRTDKVPKPEDATTQVVGKTIYLPNIIFKLMRNNTPNGQPYNPFEATFRIPPSVTKNDVRSYLAAVYGVKCTYIRTDNYIAPLKRTRVNGVLYQMKRRHGGNTTYKRAVVGLEEPFFYPNAQEDMSAKERTEHTDWLEKMFQATSVKHALKTQYVDVATGQIRKRQDKNRGRILELVMKKRAEKEQAVKKAVAETELDSRCNDHEPSVAWNPLGASEVTVVPGMNPASSREIRIKTTCYYSTPTCLPAMSFPDPRTRSKNTFTSKTLLAKSGPSFAFLITTSAVQAFALGAAKDWLLERDATTLWLALRVIQFAAVPALGWAVTGKAAAYWRNWSAKQLLATACIVLSFGASVFLDASLLDQSHQSLATSYSALLTYIASSALLQEQQAPLVHSIGEFSAIATTVVGAVVLSIITNIGALVTGFIPPQASIPLTSLLFTVPCVALGSVYLVPSTVRSLLSKHSLSTLHQHHPHPRHVYPSLIAATLPILAVSTLIFGRRPSLADTLVVGLLYMGIVKGRPKEGPTHTSVTRLMRTYLRIIMENEDSRKIFYFLMVNLAYMVVQMMWGFWTNSLGLVSDAIHMLFDCFSVGVGLMASVMANWPSNERFTYGYGRIETISGFANGIFLILISVFIVFEAIQRIVDPPEMGNFRQLLIVSTLGLGVNLFGLLAIGHHHHGGGGHSHSHSEPGHAHSHAGPKAGDHGHSHGDEKHVDRACDHDGHGHGHSHGSVKSVAPSTTPLNGYDDHHHGDNEDCDSDHSSHSGHGHSHADEAAHSHSHSQPSQPQPSHSHAHTPAPRQDVHSHSHPHSHSHSNLPPLQPLHASRSHSHSHEVDLHPSPLTPNPKHKYEYDSHSHTTNAEPSATSMKEGGGGHHDHGHSHNMRGVFLHVMADTLGSVGVIISTLLIEYYGWTGFDPIASLFIAILIASSVLPLVIDCGKVLCLDIGDRESDVRQALQELSNVEGVQSFSEPCFWPKDAESVVGSIHIKLAQSASSFDPGGAHSTVRGKGSNYVNMDRVMDRVDRLLRSKIHGLDELAIQIEGS
ncbi:putative zinc transporter msc2 [Tulasnella sp. 330]|nr:putative zinc transporter msc2 [Tulasnella sp. 330]